MMLKHAKIAVLFIILYSVCTCLYSALAEANDGDSEEITLTTYYPAPYGDYDMLSADRLIVTPYALPPDDPTMGEIFFADGSDAEYDRGLYIYLGDRWEQLGFSGQGDTWIGGVKMRASLREIWYTLSTYFSPAYGYTPYYDINDWVIKGGSDTSFKMYSPSYPSYVQVTTTGDLTPGTYKIVYGGGKIDYITGKKFLMQLYVAANGSGWWLADQYEVTNPAAVDNVQCNFWKNSTAMLPTRQTSVYLYNNTNLYIILRMHPMAEQLNWDSELGPYYSTLAIWEAAGRPTFGVTTGWDVNPNMLSNLAGPDAYADGNSGQYTDYARSYYYLKVLNTYAGGTISDVSIDVYKSE